MTKGVNHHAGLAAEGSVGRWYEARGHVVLARRWRGKGGEIDLIVDCGAEIVFVEVKASATHHAAAQRIRPAQVARLQVSAQDWLDRNGRDALTPMRFDVALVDGQGIVDVIENALM
ncbi:YraN family protein [Jannaschia sp. LMIT008]|uniref:YraN family protein n=1 Tax=Jannaschia maritima TaxID=3032585 RepID=UPI002811F688|nr:YraN family protein [Jannaschia sp. LMIT008]